MRDTTIDAKPEIRALLKSLFHAQRFGVLATESEGRPHLSLMAFAAADDLQHLVVVTRRDTQKYINLCRNAAVALLIDNRRNEALDTREALAVTITGVARDLDGEARQEAAQLYSSRHPGMQWFSTAADCAVVGVRVLSYQVVKGLDEVREWHIAGDAPAPP